MARKPTHHDARETTFGHLFLPPSTVHACETAILERSTTRLFIVIRPRLGAAIGSPFPPPAAAHTPKPASSLS